MDNWRTSLGTVFEQAWKELEDFDTPRNGTPGLITLATINGSGGPECRTVVLRRVDRKSGTVETFTDSDTPKVQEISANPNLSVLIWQPKSGFQIRLRGTGTVLQGADVHPEWAEIPDVARKNYGVTPAPGTEISEAGAYERIASPARLASLKIAVVEMDVVHLARPFDIRAVYNRSDGWAGRWLAP